MTFLDGDVTRTDEDEKFLGHSLSVVLSCAEVWGCPLYVQSNAPRAINILEHISHSRKRGRNSSYIFDVVEPKKLHLKGFFLR